MARFFEKIQKAVGSVSGYFDKLAHRRPRVSTAKSSNLIEVSVERDYSSATRDSQTIARSFHDNPWVRIATAAVARTIASLPFEVYGVAPNGKEETLTEGKEVEFFRNPSDTWSMYDLKELLVIDLHQRGRAFWELAAREQTGLLEAIPLPAVSVIPNAHGRRLIASYDYTGSGGIAGVRLLPEKVAHFRLANPDDLVGGASVYEAAGDDIELYQEAVQWNKSFFRNNTVPPAYLKIEGALPTAERKRIKTEWKNMHGGSDHAHELAIIGAGAELKVLGVSAKDSEHTTTRRDSREVILASAGVPPVVVGILDGATYANAYQQLQSYYDETITPLAQKICDELNRKVMPALGVKDGSVRVRLPIYDKLKRIKEDATRMATIRQWAQTGLLSVPEARQEGGFSAEPPEGQTLGIPGGGMPFGGGLAGAVSSARGLQFDMKAWTPEGKTDFQKDFSGRIDRYMAQVAQAVLKLFEAQYKAAVGHLVPPEGAAAHAVEKAAKKIDWKRLEEALEEAELDEEGNIRKVLARVLLDASKETAGGLGLEVKFDVRNPKVSAHLRRQAGDLIEDLHGTSLSRLRESLEEGYDKGESIPKLKRRVAEVFGDRDSDSPRMTTIARTEVARAANFGALETYLESGVVKKKEWIAAMGAATPPRPAHAAAHGQVVNVDEPFNVDGEMLLTPGDGNASPENSINCRCVAVPLVEGFEGI